VIYLRPEDVPDTISIQMRIREAEIVPDMQQMSRTDLATGMASTGNKSRASNIPPSAGVYL
jgi:hypothetical protein